MRALGIFRAARAQHPHDPRAHYWFAVTADNLGFEAVAIPAYEAALSLGVDAWPEAEAYLASSLLKTWRADIALPHILRALDAEPDNALFHVIAGDVQAGLGNLAAAERHFRRAPLLNPQLGLAWHRLGQWLGREGVLDGAEDALLRSWELGFRG